MNKREKRRQKIEQNPKNVSFEELRTLLEDFRKGRLNMERKSLEYYLALPYPIELIPDEDGFWFARVPLLEGCMTQGSSRAEALEIIDEAKMLWLETALDLNMEIPEPEPIEIPLRP